jgi:hypothetical protein
MRSNHQLIVIAAEDQVLWRGKSLTARRTATGRKNTSKGSSRALESAVLHPSPAR